MHVPSLSSFNTAVDKWTFHIAAQACYANTPRTWLASPAHLPSDLTFPLLLKPRIGEGGVGISLIHDAPQLNFILPSPNVEPALSIIQEFIPGQNVGCNVFCQDGQILAFTMQHPLDQSQSFAPASSIQFTFHEGALAQAAKLCRHLHWTGVANFDLRLHATNGQVFLLEMNPRFWATIHGSVLAGTNFVRLNSSLPHTAPAKTNAIAYHRGSHSFSAWLRAAPSDFASRLRDPLPDLLFLLSKLKQLH